VEGGCFHDVSFDFFFICVLKPYCLIFLPFSEADPGFEIPLVELFSILSRWVHDSVFSV